MHANRLGLPHLITPPASVMSTSSVSLPSFTLFNMNGNFRTSLRLCFGCSGSSSLFNLVACYDDISGFFLVKLFIFFRSGSDFDLFLLLFFYFLLQRFSVLFGNCRFLFFLPAWIFFSPCIRRFLRLHFRNFNLYRSLSHFYTHTGFDDRMFCTDSQKSAGCFLYNLIIQTIRCHTEIHTCLRDRIIHRPGGVFPVIHDDSSSLNKCPSGHNPIPYFFFLLPPLPVFRSSKAFTMFAFEAREPGLAF